MKIQAVCRDCTITGRVVGVVAVLKIVSQGFLIEFAQH
jgi:hypothetical protein